MQQIIKNKNNRLGGFILAAIMVVTVCGVAIANNDPSLRVINHEHHGNKKAKTVFDPDYRFWIYNGNSVSGQTNATNYTKSSSNYNVEPVGACEEGSTVYCYIYAKPAVSDSSRPDLTTIDGSMTTHRDL